MTLLINDIIICSAELTYYYYFQGDAILTLWKLDNYQEMKITVKQVVSCAMKIQNNYGEWMTSVGVKLRVKIGTLYSYMLVIVV